VTHKKTTEWKLCKWNVLGEAMHTAMRKVCDTPLTTVAYLLISGLDMEWEVFVKMVHERLSEEGCSTSGDAADAMIDWFGSYPDEQIRERLQRRGADHRSVYRAAALVLLFGAFSRDEWVCVFPYVFYEEGD